MVDVSSTAIVYYTLFFSFSFLQPSCGNRFCFCSCRWQNTRITCACVPSLPQSVFKNYDHDENGFISQGEFEKIAASFPFSFCVMDKAKWVVSHPLGFSCARLICDIRRRGGRQGLFVVTSVATGSKEKIKRAADLTRTLTTIHSVFCSSCTSTFCIIVVNLQSSVECLSWTQQEIQHGELHKKLHPLKQKEKSTF